MALVLEERRQDAASCDTRHLHNRTHVSLQQPRTLVLQSATAVMPLYFPSLHNLLWSTYIHRRSLRQLPVRQRVCHRRIRRRDFYYIQRQELINSLNTSCHYTHHILQQSVNLHFVLVCSVRFSPQTAIISLNSR
jgi:hypothetical protein